MWIEQLQPLSDDVCLAPGDPGRWLSAAERDRLARIRSPQRRTGWLAGRRLAKELLCSVDGRTSPGPAGWHIESRDGRGRPAPPRAFRCGRLVPWVVSISHSDRSVYVAVSTAQGCAAGRRRHAGAAFERLLRPPLADGQRAAMVCPRCNGPAPLPRLVGKGIVLQGRGKRQSVSSAANRLHDRHEPGAPAIQRAVRPRPCATDRRWAFHGRLPHCWR